MGMFQKAVRQQLKGRIAIDGPSGSGKTFTALRLATALAKGGKIAVVNTESGAVQKYIGLNPDGVPWDFDICELNSFAPTAYAEAIIEAGKADYSVLVIDSLSHAWEGEGGALEMVTNASARNKFTAWKDVTPMHNRMIGSILRSPCHVIATMRSKVEYILEDDGKGKQVPRKVGMAPVQRAGMEYEFDLYCSMDWDHVLRVSKSRCPDMDGAIAVKPSASTFGPLVSWLTDGAEVPAGYYSANESDFAKYDQQQLAAINGKQLSAIEKAKEIAAAKAEVKQMQLAETQPANAAQSISVNASCTESHVTAIKSAIEQAAQVGISDLPKRIKAQLEKHGLQKLSDLTISDAESLLTAIETKTVEKFFELSLSKPVPS
jgi:hypothetical protein